MFAASKSAKAGAVTVVTDPSFPYVPLLLETTSTNGQQNNTFLDSGTANGGVGFTITRNGTPTQGSVTPYWPDGYWSWYFSGSGFNQAVASSAPLATTTSTFTIECWIHPTATTVGTVPSIIADANSTTINGISFGTTTSNTIQLYWVDSVGGKTCTGNTVISLNAWTHIAVSVSSNIISLFVNGSAQTLTGTTTLTNRNATTSAFVIGYVQVSSAYYTGYISNLSILNGTAKYSGSFSPSTTPLSVSATNQTLLACYSNRFIDSNTATTAKTISLNGTLRTQTFQPFSPVDSYTTSVYGGSGYFNGSTDYLSAPASAAFAFGTAAWTVEAWVYVTTLQDILLFDTRSSASNSGIGFYINSSGTLYYSGSANNVLTSTSITANSWNHVAWSYDGTTLSGYINGVRGGTATPAFNITQNNGVIGRVGFAASAYMAGYISNFRVVKGTAVYSGASFTPPTSPVTAITNTSLLLNYTNAGIYDAAVQNNVITVGDAQASTTQKQWSPTSMKFDGTGDWLTAIDGPQLQLGTGDFTIDGWFYLSATGAIYGMVSKGTATTGWSVNVTVLNKLQFSYTASNLTGATTLSASTWYYFAVVRSGSATGNLKLYLNGTADATSGGAVTDNFNQTSILYVGADRIGGSALNGYLQDVRITKLARTITTPTAAFPTR